MIVRNNNAESHAPRHSPVLRVGLVVSPQAWALATIGAVVSLTYIGYLSFLGFLAPPPVVQIHAVLATGLLSTLVFRFFLVPDSHHFALPRVAGWGLLAWMSIVHVAWYPTFTAAGAEQEFFRTAAQTLLAPVMLWAASGAIGSRQGSFPHARLTAWACAAALGSAVLLGVYHSTASTGHVVFYFYDYTLGTSFNYLLLADYIAIAGLWIVGAYSARPVVQASVFVAIILLLLLSYSRTSLYLFSLIGLLPILLSSHRRSRHEQRHSQTLPTAAAVIALVLLSAMLIALISVVPDLHIRFLTPILNPLSDESLVARISIQNSVWSSLTAGELLLGSLPQQFSNDYSTTYYIHNSLSYLTAYGLGPFALLLLLCSILAIRMIRLPRTPMHLSISLILSYGILAALLSRSYLWSLLWFCMGCASTYTSRHR